MIYIGNNEYPIYLGDSEIPAIYCGEELIYPVNLGTLTGITIEDLVWKTDVPASGGTATEENCTYRVVGHYDSGKSRTVTNDAVVTGSLVVSATTAETREMVGVLQLTATYEGFTAIGSVNVYQAAAAPDYASMYLTFRITSPGKIIWRSRNNNYTNVSIQYSFDSGTSWSSITSKTSSTNGFDVSAGDVIMFKGNNTTYTKVVSSTNCYNGFTGTTAGVTIEGNIMSLLYGDNFIGQTTLPTSYTLSFLFFGMSGLTDASNCILPATTLTPYCYRNLFNDNNNFNGAPKLPATTLAEGCYTNMFMNCNALEVAPDLPAKTLVKQCYDGMLYMQNNHKNLRYIKCLATDKSASNCLRNFHHSSYISSTGTFVKYPGVSWTTGGTEGIPTGWTVLESTE